MLRCAIAHRLLPQPLLRNHYRVSAMSFAISSLRASVLAAAILATPLLAEARKLDLQLQRVLPAMAAGETLEVIVSFHGSGPLSAAQLARLDTLGLKGVSMRGLPSAGVRATPSQVQALLA